MGSSISKSNKKKCGTIEDAQQIRIDSSPLHCPVCLNVFHKAPEILPCGHSHCTDCLDKIKAFALRNAENRSTTISIECPLCRAKVPVQRFRVKNYAIEAILDSLETYNAEDDPTNEIIASLELAIKRKNLEKREDELEINQLKAQLKSQRKISLGLFTMLTLGLVGLLLKGLLFGQ